MSTFQIGDCPTMLVTTETSVGGRPLRQGRIELTVRNTAAEDRTGRIAVLSEGAGPDWFAIEGAAPTHPAFLEREFAAGAAQKVTVLVSVPPDAAPGDYVFQVQVAEEADPNNDFVNGPAVALKVPPLVEKPAARPFPWWAVAVASVIVVAIGGGAWFYANYDPAPPPPPPPPPPLEAAWDGVDSAPQTELVPGQATRPVTLRAVAHRGETPVEIDATFSLADTCPWVVLTGAEITGTVPYWLPSLQAPCETVARGTVTDAGGETVDLPDLPLRFVPKARNIADLAVGAYFACALSASNSVACWGAAEDNGAGQYGGGEAPPNLKAKIIAAGFYSACALRVSGGVVCWGDRQGNEATVPDDVATDPENRVTGLIGGSRISCALFDNSGDAYSCWASGEFSMGGSGYSDPLLAWQPFRSRDGRTRCALDGYGSLNCALTNGTHVKVVDGTAAKVVDFTEPDNVRVCAVLADDTVRCHVFMEERTVDLAGMPEGIQQIVDTGLYLCVLTRSGEVSCMLPLELPSTQETFQPAVPDGLRAVRIVAGDFYDVCAITADDKIACWGVDEFSNQIPIVTRIPTAFTF